MTTHPDRCDAFRALHYAAETLVLPNPWDIGSAKLYETIGFKALATTSAGFANTLGRLDGTVSLPELVRHCADMVAAVDVPVATDFENGFADDPDEVATNIETLATTGVAGFSIEDYSGDDADPIYPVDLAVARVAAAAEAAQFGDARMVLTARAENYLHGRPDLADTIARLQAFEEAGADVVYAPGIVAIDDIRRVVEAVDIPVNVLALPGVAPVAELHAVGVARVSVGSGFSLAAMGAAAAAGRELLEYGTTNFWSGALGNDDKLGAWS